MAEENKNEVMEQETEETTELRPITGADLMIGAGIVIGLYEVAKFGIKKGVKKYKSWKAKKASETIETVTEEDIVDADVKEVKSEE